MTLEREIYRALEDVVGPDDISEAPAKLLAAGAKAIF